MPMIDVIFPKGSLDEAAKAKLNATLWETALRWEGIEATEGAASVAWVFLDERRVMVGFMDQERIDRMVAELTNAVLTADGKVGDGSPRVFCIVEEIPSGTWGIDGKVWTTVFTAQTLGLDERGVERMRAVVAERPRLDVKIPLEA